MTDILSYLSAFTNLAWLITAIALVITLIFNVLNFKQSERVRRESATLEHLKDFQSETFARMDALFSRLPDNLLPAQLGKLDSESMAALQFIGRHLESLGIAVSLHVLDIEVVERTLGNNIMLYWKKIQPLATEMRKDPATRDFAKWTEWLSDTIASRQDKGVKS